MAGEFHLHPRLNQAEKIKRCDWPECHAACCIYGAWVDKLHAEDILNHASEIGPLMEEEHQSPSSWFDGQEEPDDHALSGRVVHTTIIPNPYHLGGTSCIFLRKDFKCALQAAAEAVDEHPWRFKPFYCILHPLDIDEQGRITLDEVDLLLREPTTCLQPSRKPVRIKDLFAEELGYLVGKKSKSPK
ncbi:MAG: DUF3109 family protein [Anaerolineales bacterium]|nr:DUF3109 family protein [Anaerolineales bacterium]